MRTTDAPILGAHFASVEWRSYDGDLVCTNADDVLAYLVSLPPGERATDDELQRGSPTSSRAALTEARRRAVASRSDDSARFVVRVLTLHRRLVGSRLRVTWQAVGPTRREQDATRDDRPRPDGRQPRAPADARRPRVRRLRRERRRGEGARRRRRRPARTSIADFCAEAHEAAGGVDHGAGRVRRLHDRRAARRTSTPGDIIIDGGNSYYRDDIDRAARLKPSGIHYVDVGTSGGVFGLDRGFCLMIGGEDDVVTPPRPDLQDHRAGRRRRAAHARAAPATRATAEQGYLHCGPNGAGHFVKMVHNGIEYGIMAAYAEGLNILQARQRRHRAAAGRRRDRAAARPAVLPVRPRPARRSPRCGGAGASIASWLLDLTAHSLSQHPDLSDFEGRVSDSGEGRWTIHAAIDEGVPADVLSAALYARFTSRGQADFADKLLSAMRKEFGGHDEKLDQTIGETK